MEFVSILRAWADCDVVNVHFADCAHGKRSKVKWPTFEASSIPDAVRIVRESLQDAPFGPYRVHACSYCVNRSQRECPTHFGGRV